MITQKRLKELLHYDPDTGIFTWLADGKCKRKAGDTAGTLDSSNGYIRIRIDKRSYVAHRLAWLYMHGSWPDELLDHINRDRADNRAVNLRQVNYTYNAYNCSPNSNCLYSNYKGVSYDAVSKRNRAKRWIASIQSKKHRLRERFHTEKEAALQYNEWAKELHGEYAVLNVID